MPQNVTLGVKSDLSSIQRGLAQLSAIAADVSREMESIGDGIDKNLEDNAKDVEKNLEKVRSLGARVADQLRGYFKDLLGSAAHTLDSLGRDIGLRSQLKGAARDAIDLNDRLRKVQATLGFSADQMARFQDAATAAFADIGLSGSQAGEAIAAITQTSVRGEGNMLSYAGAAGRLGIAGGQTGQIGDIAQLMAQVAQQRGTDPNDTKAMQQLAEDVRRTMVVTGQSPTAVLEKMVSLFGSMADDMRRQIGTGGASRLQAVGSVVPGIEKLIDVLTKGGLERLPAEMQGLKGVIGANGVDFDKLEKIIGIGNRIGFDKTASWQTALGDRGAAETMVRLVEQRSAARSAQARIGTVGGTLDSQARESRGIGESITAIGNQTKGAIENALGAGKLAGKANDLLGGIANNKVASVAATGFAALAAAGGAKLLGGLAGKGGVLGDVGGTAARAAAAEQLTGQKTMPVYVVNVGEIASAIGAKNIGGLGGADPGGKLGKLTGTLEKLSTGLAALGVGFAVGQAIDSAVTIKRKGNFEGSISDNIGLEIARGFAALGFTKDSPLVGGMVEAAQTIQRSAATQERIDKQQRAIDDAANKKARISNDRSTAR